MMPRPLGRSPGFRQAQGLAGHQQGKDRNSASPFTFEFGHSPLTFNGSCTACVETERDAARQEEDYSAATASVWLSSPGSPRPPHARRIAQTTRLAPRTNSPALDARRLVAWVRSQP